MVNNQNRRLIILIWKETPFLYACQLGKMDFVNYMYSQCNRVIRDRIRKNAYNCIHIAASTGDESLLFFAMNMGLVNTTAAEGMTPLHISIKENKMNILRILMERGCNPNVITQDGFTPLHFAAFNGNLEAIKILSSGRRSRTPLLMLFDRFDRSPIQAAMDYCPDRHDIADALRSIDIIPTFMHYADKQLVEKIEWLPEIIPNFFNKRDILGQNLLHLACRFPSKQLIRFLLDNGLKCHSTDNEGNTPLHAAVKHRNVEVIPILIKYFPEAVDRVNGAGQTPLDICFNPQVKALLMRAKSRGSSCIGSSASSTCYDYPGSEFSRRRSVGSSSVAQSISSYTGRSSLGNAGPRLFEDEPDYNIGVFQGGGSRMSTARPSSEASYSGSVYEYNLEPPGSRQLPTYGPGSVTSEPNLLKGSRVPPGSPSYQHTEILHDIGGDRQTDNKHPHEPKEGAEVSDHNLAALDSATESSASPYVGLDHDSTEYSGSFKGENDRKRVAATAKDAFIDCQFRGDTCKLQLLLNSNTREYAYILLNLACLKSYDRVVKYLLNMGLKPNKMFQKYGSLYNATIRVILNFYGKKLTYEELRYSYLEGGNAAFETLVLGNEDVAAMSNPDPILHEAARLDDPETISSIINHCDVDVNQLNSRKQTPMHIASLFGSTRALQKLIELGADPDVKDKELPGASETADLTEFSRMLSAIPTNGDWNDKKASSPGKGSSDNRGSSLNKRPVHRKYSATSGGSIWVRSSSTDSSSSHDKSPSLIENTKKIKDLLLNGRYQLDSRSSRSGSRTGGKGSLTDKGSESEDSYALDDSSSRDESYVRGKTYSSGKGYSRGGGRSDNGSYTGSKASADKTRYSTDNSSKYTKSDIIYSRGGGYTAGKTYSSDKTDTNDKTYSQSETRSSYKANTDNTHRATDSDSKHDKNSKSYSREENFTRDRRYSQSETRSNYKANTDNTHRATDSDSKHDKKSKSYSREESSTRDGRSSRSETHRNDKSKIDDVHRTTDNDSRYDKKSKSYSREESSTRDGRYSQSDARTGGAYYSSDNNSKFNTGNDGCTRYNVYTGDLYHSTCDDTKNDRSGRAYTDEPYYSAYDNTKAFNCCNIYTDEPYYSAYDYTKAVNNGNIYGDEPYYPAYDYTKAVNSGNYYIDEPYYPAYDYTEAGNGVNIYTDEPYYSTYDCAGTGEGGDGYTVHNTHTGDPYAVLNIYTGDPHYLDYHDSKYNSNGRGNSPGKSSTRDRGSYGTYDTVPSQYPASNRKSILTNAATIDEDYSIDESSTRDKTSTHGMGSSVTHGSPKYDKSSTRNGDSLADEGLKHSNDSTNDKVSTRDESSRLGGNLPRRMSFTESNSMLFEGNSKLDRAKSSGKMSARYESSMVGRNLPRRMSFTRSNSMLFEGNSKSSSRAKYSGKMSARYQSSMVGGNLPRRMSFTESNSMLFEGNSKSSRAKSSGKMSTCDYSDYYTYSCYDNDSNHHQHSNNEYSSYYLYSTYDGGSAYGKSGAGNRISVYYDSALSDMNGVNSDITSRGKSTTHDKSSARYQSSTHEGSVSGVSRSLSTSKPENNKKEANNTSGSQERTKSSGHVNNERASQPEGTVRGVPNIFMMVENNDQDHIRESLKNGTVRVDDRDQDGLTPLMYAAKFGHVNLIKDLATTQTLNLQNVDGNTALNIAISFSQFKFAYNLMKHNYKNMTFETNKNGDDVVDYALKRDGTPRYIIHFLLTIIGKERFGQILPVCVNKGIVRINEPDERGETLLHYLVKYKKGPKIKILCDSNIRPIRIDVPNSDGFCVRDYKNDDSRAQFIEYITSHT